MKKMKLTAKRIAKLRNKPGRYRDEEVRGLILQVGRYQRRDQVQREHSPDNASWVLRYERNGWERWYGLGSLQVLDLKAARQKARGARQGLLDGVDPIERKKADKAAQKLAVEKAITFEEAAREYFAQHKGKWTNRKHQRQFLSTLTTYAFPKIGKLSVAAVDTGMVLKVIEPIWHDKTPTADKTRRRIEAVLDWATVRNYRTGDNPARWKGHLGEVLPERGKIQKPKHHAALPYSEIGSFMSALRSQHGPAARALEFTILTAARTGEITGAVWSEIDLVGKVWTIPAERMKMDREHRVPLSDRAVEILKALPTEENNDFVFIGKLKPNLSHSAMMEVLHRMKRSDITVHGFRSCFRDWSAECTAYPNHVLEQALAHSVGSAVERAYRRGDLFLKRVKLMADWSRFCSKPVGASTVTSMMGRKAS
jgi:integrase